MKQDRASARAHGTVDVVVVGGGIIGLACAWRIAQRGASVAVVDPETGRGASWAAAGMLAPVTEVHYGEEALLRLNLLSAEVYPAFVAELTEETGRDVGYRRAGTVMVARDGDDNAALDEVFTYQRELGLDVERLNGRECRSLEPALSPRVRGGIHVAGDHQVDNRALVAALTIACNRRGVEIVPARATKVEISSGRVAGVDTDAAGSISTGRVVLACGAGLASIAGLEQAGLPKVRPVKGQLIHLRGNVPLVHGNVRGLEVYLVGRSDGRLVVGATVEEQGFDVTITAGALHDLLRTAYELVPGITELEVVETAAGLRPATPDNAPVLGPTTVEGLAVATGHYRNGVLLSPVTAAAIAEVVHSGRVSQDIQPFLPSRFSRAGSVR
jgi:glycine oxidase